MSPRFIEQPVQEALSDTRVVLITGPRQAGKTTLAEKLANSAMPFLTLDDQTTLDTARADSVGFVRGLDRAVIDENQRTPQVLLAIKRSVATDKRPGRFLLTGSANLMMLPQVADSRAGRMEIAERLPLSRSELRGRRCEFLGRVLRGKPPIVGGPVAGQARLQRVTSRGHPEARQRASWPRRQKWLLEYTKAVREREVCGIAPVEHGRQMPRPLRILAQHCGRLANYSSVGAPLGIGHVTTQKYTGILAQLLLLRTLQPWHTNELINNKVLEVSSGSMNSILWYRRRRRLASSSQSKRPIARSGRSSPPLMASLPNRRELIGGSCSPHDPLEYRQFACPIMAPRDFRRSSGADNAYGVHHPSSSRVAILTDRPRVGSNRTTSAGTRSRTGLRASPNAPSAPCTARQPGAAPASHQPSAPCPLPASAA